MEVNPDLRRLIHKAAPTHELRELLRRQNVLTLRDEGVQLSLEGKTSLEEILRVTHDDDSATDVPVESVQDAEGKAA